MAERGPLVAGARVDQAGWLIAADEPLASFHRRCGGELPGPLVTPALLEIVRQCREYRLRLAREVRAQDETDEIRFWLEAQPDGENVRLAIRTWKSRPLPAISPLADDLHRSALGQHLAGLSARLGPCQEVLAITGHGPELAALAERMEAGAGRAWTDFVTMEGTSHHQPLHWRLLDGGRAKVPGNARGWIIRIIPLGEPEPGSAGFELLLLAEHTADEAGEPPMAGANLAPDARADQTPPPPVSLDQAIAPVLRRPVARIIANAQTIRAQLAGPLAQEYSDYAADIAAAGEHLLALIDDLAALDLVEAEGFATQADRIDLADIARRAAGILSLRAHARAIRLDPPKADECAPAIGEFRRVLQILLNLVGNAIRYSPEGAQIWLRTETWGGQARVIVADQGEGLDAGEQARIFNKFERLGRSGDGGSGLGLYISRRLAEAMGGQLTVESARGQGARFILDLPADEGNDSPSPAFEPAPWPSAPDRVQR